MSVHFPFSVRLPDLFVTSLVFMKGPSCCVIRRHFKKSWAVRPWHGKFIEVISLHDFCCYLRATSFPGSLILPPPGAVRWETLWTRLICGVLRGFWHLCKQWLELFESTELISYLPSYLFLQRRCSFTLRKLYTSLSSEILIFFQLSNWAYVFQACCNDMIQMLTPKSVECVFVRFSQDHGFDPPCGSHQLPVFLKYSVRLKLLV